MKTLLTCIVFLATFALSGCGQAGDLATIDGVLIKKDGAFYTPYCAQNGVKHCIGARVEESVSVADVISFADVIGENDSSLDPKLLKAWKERNYIEDSANIGPGTKFTPGNKYYFNMFASS